MPSMLHAFLLNDGLSSHMEMTGSLKTAVIVIDMTELVPL